MAFAPENDPFAHNFGDCAASKHWLPAGQSAQEDAPSADQVPAGQGEHSRELTPAYEPAAHWTGSLKREGHELPAGQSEQAAAPPKA
jgi:hypothetical protein